MRTPITLKIKFKSSNLEQFIERYSVDVSRGGIFIRTKEPLPVGTQLRFEFQLQDASALIAGDGTVVWIREHDPARQGVAPGMGVRFDKLAADSQKVLDRILTEKQKRGDAQLESRFDAGVRASASASGTLSSASARVAGHNDFSGGDSRTMTPLPGAVPGLATPDDEFGNESTRVMQNELVQSLADKTRPADDLANAFSDPEPTRKASVEELKLAVAGSALERIDGEPPAKSEPKVEVAAEAVKPEEKQEAPKVEVTAKVEAKAEAKVEEPKAKPEEQKAKAEAKPDEKKAKTEAKPDEKKAKAEAKPDEKKAKAEDKKVKPEPKADAKQPERPATAAPYQKEAPPPRKRSLAPVYIGLAVVAAVGGYTVFRNNGEETAAPPHPTATAQAPAPTTAAPPAVAQNEQPTAPENAAEAKATGDKPAEPATPAEQPNPAAPEKEPTAAIAEAPGLAVPVTSDPAGATVTVDGKALDAPTPTTIPSLDPKKVYDVRVALKGFHAWKIRLKPKAGEKVDAALVPNEKVVQVATTPSGAEVVLDGRRVGRTPFTIHKLDLSKSHALEVKRAGFVPQKREISAADQFESKGDKDVLAVAMTLEAAPKPAAAARPAVHKPAHKPAVAQKPTEAATPAEKPAEVAAEKPEKPAMEKPAVEKPAVEKPATAEKPVVEKPATEKPATAKPAAEKPATEKPATEKPATEKPAGEKAGIKVPSWMKSKPAAGEGSTPPASETSPQ